jgi:nucleolar protein 56
LIIVFAHEAGISVLDEKLKVIGTVGYSKNPAVEYKGFLEGEEYDLIKATLEKVKALPSELVLVQTQQLRRVFLEELPKVDLIQDDKVSKIVSDKMRIILESGFAENEQKAYEALREFSLRQSEAKITEESTRLDLQAMEAVLALDELDKMINIIGTRVKEWYQIHFPEILQFYEEPVELCKFVSDVGDRRNLDEDKAATLKFSENKKRALLSAAQKSRGGTFREEDIERIVVLANLVKDTNEVKKRMSNFIEGVMKKIAPNVTAICGATIGARLISKAGGLEKLAMLPSSTIQILGAEKAIFRAIKTGAKPPKHGVIFQHALVHESPKWQRGRIARALASKIAIAARIDFFRKELDPSVEEDLMVRIKEIRSSKEKVRMEEKSKKASKFRGRKR